MTVSLLSAYGFDSENCAIQAYGNGLINNTWLLKSGGGQYIVQKINTNVFKDPFQISDNINAVGSYLKTHFPDYLFVMPLLSAGKGIVYDGDGYYRMFPFVKNSVTFTTLQNSQLAFEAAKQFAKFTHLLSGFDTNLLKETLPDFHNLTLRYTQFNKALSEGNKERINEAGAAIAQIKKYRYIVDGFEKIKINASFKKRVMHHDAKISNVLFDEENKGMCLIDLDTLMPGYFISDIGDMMRTYLSPAGEEEKDFTKIEIRADFFEAVVEGYLSEMSSDLSDAEKNSFVYAGKFMIYMQAMRFLTDYLFNDIYYGSKYEGHNLVRAKNQLHLLNELNEKEGQFLQRT